MRLVAAPFYDYIYTPMTRTSRNLLFYKLPPILFAGMILLLSSLPNAHAPSFDIRNIDKFYHGLEYFVFGLLMFRAFPEIHLSNRKGVYYLLLFLFGLVYAGLDETVQYFVPNRDSSIGDWVADIVGYMVAGLSILIYRFQK